MGTPAITPDQVRATVARIRERAEGPDADDEWLHGQEDELLLRVLEAIAQGDEHARARAGGHKVGRNRVQPVGGVTEREVCQLHADLLEARTTARRLAQTLTAWESWLIGQGYQVQNPDGEYLTRPVYIGSDKSSAGVAI